MINSHKKRYLLELFLLVLLMLVTFNFIQSIEQWKPFIRTSIKWKVLFGFHLAIFFLLVYLIYRSIKTRGVVGACAEKFRALDIPRGAKTAILIVFFGNLITIAIAKSYYPFYEVGMFRWTSKFSNPEKIVYSTKYYYTKNGEPIILDLRKEGFFLLKDYLGWGYTHEFTFAATYHNKGQKENFDFIQEIMKTHGVDSLWVGVQSVNYATGEVVFDPDICRAIEVNSTKKIHYGPIYIPEYQKVKCSHGN